MDGEAAGDEFGNSVELSAAGQTIAIEARKHDEIGVVRGHVKVFKFVSGSWIQQGNNIDGEAVHDESGAAISLSADGTTIAIGAALNSENATYAGHARVFSNSLVYPTQEELSQSPPSTIFPNPSQGQVTINLRPKKMKAEFEVFDMVGRLFFSSTANVKQKNSILNS